VDERDEARLRARLEADDFDGVLIVDDPDNPALIVIDEPQWLGELQAVLSADRRRERIRDASLTSDQVTRILAPVEVAVRYVGSGPPRTRARAITAIVLVSLMTAGIFSGLSYQFVAITGEKQLRVTEQIVAAIPPQLWIDGKILGISLLSLVSSMTYVVGILGFLLMSRVFGGTVSIPEGAFDIGTALVLVPIAAGGFLLWNTFFGAIAATINDPNTSARSGLLMLPVFPVVAALMMIRYADTSLAMVLAVFPFTSPAFLPLRLVLEDVPFWEAGLALLLLAASIWFCRRMAGKVFGASVLMYGKEPTWSEMVRWVRAAE
jgi:ABC-2 type transport system permease protein